MGKGSVKHLIKRILASAFILLFLPSLSVHAEEGDGHWVLTSQSVYVSRGYDANPDLPYPESSFVISSDPSGSISSGETYSDPDNKSGLLKCDYLGKEDGTVVFSHKNDDGTVKYFCTDPADNLSAGDELSMTVRAEAEEYNGSENAPDICFYVIMDSSEMLVNPDGIDYFQSYPEEIIDHNGYPSQTLTGTMPEGNAGDICVLEFSNRAGYYEGEYTYVE